jgi:hypothetical protein
MDGAEVVSAVTAGGSVTGREVSATLISSDMLLEVSTLIEVRISFSGIRLSTEGRLRSQGKI